MALAESTALPDTSANAPGAVPLPSDPQIRLPAAALARLPLLHAEAARTASLCGFLNRSIRAAWVLILGAGLTYAAGGRSLPENFAWGLLLFLGVVAMVRLYMRGFTLKRAPVESLAADLRFCLFYAGFAWGAGAFLALPSSAGAWALTNFAAVPVALMALALRDRGATFLFALPVAAFAIAAGALDVAGGVAGAIGVIMAVGAIITVTFLVTNRAAGEIPAGLALR